MPRVRVTNADTYTKADSTRISPSIVNMGLERNDLCEFYWSHIRMIFLKYYFEEVVLFLKHARLHFVIFLRKRSQKEYSFIVLTANSISKSHLLSV